MEYSKDAPFADVFICNGEFDFHDYYYISPKPVEEDNFYYCVNRTGIESKSPSLFLVERNASIKCGEIFCIFSGKGCLKFRNQIWHLKKNQVVVLPPGEPHAYESDPRDPFGMSWLELYGGDSRRILQHVVDTQGPVIEGSIFSDASAALGLLQQRLMTDERQEVSLDIYRLLLELLKNERRLFITDLSEDVRENFQRVEAYIDAHIGDKISNTQLALICGVSRPYFIAQFKALYHMPPQEYIMRRRIRKGAQILMQTNLTVEDISERLGFCNSSHFIRRFHKEEGMTPLKYRNTYRVG